MKKHKPYLRLQGYQMIRGIGDDECAEYLGIAKRTFQEKRNGRLDFSPPEAKALATLLNASQDDLFFTP